MDQSYERPAFCEYPSVAANWWRRILIWEFRSLRNHYPPRLLAWSMFGRLLPHFVLSPLRALTYKWAGCRIAGRVSIHGPLSLVGEGDIGSRLSIAGGTIIAPHVVLGLDGDITIGHNVSIGPHVKLHTGSHSLGFGSRRMNRTVTPKPIVVEDGVWIAMDSLILPGVTLGRGCVVSAGSVVTQDVPANTLVGGNPAGVQSSLPFGDR